MKELQQLELDELRDEKAEILQKMMDSANEEANDPLTGASLDEVKVQNRKLRNAINSLTFGFEEERKRMEAASKDETKKDK